MTDRSREDIRTTLQRTSEEILQKMEELQTRFEVLVYEYRCAKSNGDPEERLAIGLEINRLEGSVKAIDWMLGGTEKL